MIGVSIGVEDDAVNDSRLISGDIVRGNDVEGIDAAACGKVRRGIDGKDIHCWCKDG